MWRGPGLEEGYVRSASRYGNRKKGAGGPGEVQSAFDHRATKKAPCGAKQLMKSGAEGDRTLNLLIANEVLSQLSYRPFSGLGPSYHRFQEP